MSPKALLLAAVLAVALAQGVQAQEVSGARAVAAAVPVPELPAAKLAAYKKYHAELVKKYEAHLAETAASFNDALAKLTAKGNFTLPTLNYTLPELNATTPLIPTKSKSYP